MERFAEKTAKQACARLEELFSSFAEQLKHSSGSSVTRRSVGRKSAQGIAAMGDLEWQHRHMRPAALMKVEEPKRNSTNLADIWHAVRKPKLKPLLDKGAEAPERSVSPRKDSDQDFSAENVIEPPEAQPDPVALGEARGVKPNFRPLPGLLDDDLSPPPPVVDHPSAPPSQPEPLENPDTEQKPLASALQKNQKATRHTRRVLPGLMDSEQSRQSERSQEVQFEEAQLSHRSAEPEKIEDQGEDRTEDEVPDVLNQQPVPFRGKSVRRKTRATGKMSTVWDPLVQRVNQPTGMDASEYSAYSDAESSAEGGGQSCRQIYEMIIYAWPLEYLVLTAILLNAVIIGMETDTMSQQLLPEPPNQFIIFGWVFCIFFTLEMVLKVSANPNRFFKGVGWQMNIFDLSLVALQWLDVVVTASATDDSSSTNFNVMRIVRMVRLVRIVRSYRVLRMLGEVRAIVWSVGTSFKPLLGAMLVLVGVIYLMAVYLVDTCNAYRVSMESTDAGFQPLGRYFGSVGGGMLTLWQAMTGGIDWATVMSPLLEHTSPIAVAIFLFYIAFSLLALLNLITGVFVESAVKRGKEDKDNYLVQYVRGVFKKMEQTNARVITWEDFQASLDTKEMKELFKAIDLDISEAHCVFKILDLDDDGTLDADEFLSGCLRLRGPAKTLDVLVLMREIRSMQNQIMEQMEGAPPNE